MINSVIDRITRQCPNILWAIDRLPSDWIGESTITGATYYLFLDDDDQLNVSCYGNGQQSHAIGDCQKILTCVTTYEAHKNIRNNNDKT